MGEHGAVKAGKRGATEIYFEVVEIVEVGLGLGEFGG
jgi:hypothetical protein